MRLVLSCEHGGKAVPRRWRALFAGRGDLLATHRAYDEGALPLGRALARRLGVELWAASTTRLLVDLNRAPHNRRVFSEVTRDLPAEQRRELLETYHAPHRARVEAAVRKALPAVHVAVHTFTPRLDGVVRRADVGLLYDPARPGEVDFCRRWQRLLHAAAPGLRVRRNYPYRGATDGLCTHLRRRLPAATYVGVELEVNVAALRRDPRRLGGLLATTLAECMAGCETGGWRRLPKR